MRTTELKLYNLIVQLHSIKSNSFIVYYTRWIEILAFNTKSNKNKFDMKNISILRNYITDSRK